MNEEQIVMDIIINAGEAKGYAYEALSKAKEGKFDEVDDLFEKAEEALGRAHDIQTSLLTREANGEKYKCIDTVCSFTRSLNDMYVRKELNKRNN